MSIIRVRKDARYFSASNEPFVDKRLSWEARGLMGYLLSKPNGWEVRNEDIIKMGPAGEHKVRRMLAELRKYGYMNRIRVTKPDHTFDWITEVYESPSQNPTPGASRRLSTSGSSTSGKVPHIVKTEPLNTEPETGAPTARRANTIPEVALYREVTMLYPPKELFDDVVQSLARVRDRLGREVTKDDLMPFRKAWVRKGYNRFAITWLEWAETGQVPVNGTWKPKNQNADFLRDFTERHGVNG